MPHARLEHSDEFTAKELTYCCSASASLLALTAADLRNASPAQATLLSICRLLRLAANQVATKFNCYSCILHDSSQVLVAGSTQHPGRKKNTYRMSRKIARAYTIP